MEVKSLLELVRSAGPLFYDHDRALNVKVKGRSDFVTMVDTQVQEYMREALGRMYPQVQFMGEEKDNSGIDFDGAVWILDPVDGTTNLICDFHNSALSLGLCEQGRVTLGIVYQPFSDELFFAQRGKGAFLNGSPIHVSSVQRLEESLIAVGTSPYHRELTEANFRDLRRIFDRCVDIRRMGAASIDLAYVACGRVAAYLERNLKPWDFAAGKLLVEEAGGTVTDFNGREVSPTEAGDIVAGNGYIGKILVKEVLNS